MKQQGGGVILSTGSEMVFTADPAIPGYVASKGGVTCDEGDGHQPHQDNIRVNAFCPGETNTPLLQSEIDNSPTRQPRRRHMTPGHRSVAWRRRANRRTVALFLASDESSFVVGSTYLADGGFTSSI